MKTLDLKLLLWLSVGILVTLSVLGLTTREPLQAAHRRKAMETPPPPPLTSTSSLPESRPTRPEPAPPPAESAPKSLPKSLLAGHTSRPECPLSRVAMVRGSDSEASEGGGFYAARKNGIHGAVDLNGSVGEAVFAVADGKVVVASRSDWGKLGRTVVLDHQDGTYSIYGHLHTVEVEPNSRVTAGHMIGTMGYSGNAASLQAKNLPPHLHFAYLRDVAGMNGRAAPLARVKDSGDGFRTYSAKDAIMADVVGILNPIYAVKFLKCWEDPPAAAAHSKRSTLIMPR